MKTKISEHVKIAPTVWPDCNSKVQPGDFSQVMPKGTGLSFLPVALPWDTPKGILQRTSFYGWQAHEGHYLQDAPLVEPGGGVIYFGANSWNGVREQPDIQTVLHLMGMGRAANDRHYLAFLEISENPLQQRFLCQLRLFPAHSLAAFGITLTQETAHYSQQSLTLGECVWEFIQDQNRELTEGVLDGAMGGDGDNYESLCFGLMVENSYYGVLRIWSRAWIVTK